MSELSQTQPPVRSKKTFYLLILVFILPFTMAVLLHLFDLIPGGRSYGNLIQPPKILQIPVLKDATGKAFNPEQWNKIWSVVTVDNTGCAAPCAARLHMLKQVHTSMNKEIDRIQRVLLVPTTETDAYNEIQKKYPDLIILTSAEPEMAKFLTEFNTASGVAESNIFLVDPLGNLMMSYPGKFDPKGLRSDLTRLLKNSWAG
jgi:cytochrome oxidase Cu insertion factor (SCO1/SenC/PrrC family)